METDNKPKGRFDKTKETTVDREKIEKVISGNTKVRKNNVRKFTDVFVAEDVSNVKSHIFADVLIPALKKLVTDIVKDGVDMLINGRVTRTNKSNSFFSDHVSYDRFSSSSSNPKPIRTINRFSYDDIEFETRTDAEAALDQMHACIRTYGFVTVGAMYEMVGRTAPFTAENYGWTTINNAYVDRVYGGGYVIKLPRAIPIER